MVSRIVQFRMGGRRFRFGTAGRRLHRRAPAGIGVTRMARHLLFWPVMGVLLVLLLGSPATAIRTMTIYDGNGQTATVATPVPVPPAVRVLENGIPVSGVRVVFSVTGGGGTVTGPVAVTGAGGIATAGGWTLGTRLGTNTLSATNGSLSVAFTATGVAGAASRMVKFGGDNQIAVAGSPVALPPTVRVLDVYQNPVGGRQVVFTVSVGGGSVLPSGPVSTNANGIASVSRWTLGPSPGTNSLVATSGQLVPITFIATATQSATVPQISGISPESALNTGVQTLVITGSGLAGTSAVLSRNGQPAIIGSLTGTDTQSLISRRFNLSGAAPGTWNLIVLNSAGKSDTEVFIVRSGTAAVTGIAPSAGTANSTVAVTVTGSGFVPSLVQIRLYRGTSFIAGSVNTGGTAQQVTGSFSLNRAVPGTYDVCVLPDGTEAELVCGPGFTVRPDRGSIRITSDPSGGQVFLDNVLAGSTPLILDGIVPGPHTLLVRLPGYSDWSAIVTVSPGSVSTVSAIPAPVTITTPTTTTTTFPTMPMTTKSPADPAIALAAAVAVFIAMRRIC